MVHLSVLANITNNSSCHDIFVKNYGYHAKNKMIYIYKGSTVAIPNT